MQKKVPIKFSKMHGLGNDFVVIETIGQTYFLEKIPVSMLADRHQGIGFDQLLIIGSSSVADFSCRIFNSDGSEAEQCGNGMRCVARFIAEQKLSMKKSFTIELTSSIVPITIHDFNHIEVDMGVPVLKGSQIIPINQESFSVDVISLGNPHAILQVSSLNNFSVNSLGKQISQHTLFPQGINVGFMEIIDRQHIRLKTFERGSGETLACGSNSCAAVVSGIKHHLLEPNVKVELELGCLNVTWKGENQPVLIRGPAEQVFEGTLNLDT